MATTTATPNEENVGEKIEINQSQEEKAENMNDSQESLKIGSHLTDKDFRPKDKIVEISTEIYIYRIGDIDRK